MPLSLTGKDFSCFSPPHSSAWAQRGLLLAYPSNKLTAPAEGAKCQKQAIWNRLSSPWEFDLDRSTALGDAWPIEHENGHEIGVHR